jgi:hypothetical protein
MWGFKVVPLYVVLTVNLSITDADHFLEVCYRSVSMTAALVCPNLHALIVVTGTVMYV